MKKISLLTLAIALSSALLAQNNPTIGSTSHAPMRTPMTKTPRFGIDVGVNMARYNENSDEFANPSLAPNTNNKTSLHAAVFVDIPVGGMFSIRPQIMYSGQGSKMSVKQATGTGTNTFSFEEDLKYIYVAPAVLQLMTTGGFMIETGPQVGYLISAKVDGTAPQGWSNGGDLDERRKKIDLLWGAGIGYMTRIGLGVHARYNYSFTNLLDVEDNAMQGQLKNRVMQFGVMYQFGAHK